MATSFSSKRHSILPPISQAGPKPPIQFSSSITIADSALLTGSHTITIRTESVVHPRARLDSSGGRITIGRRCIIHERSLIGAAPGGGLPTTPSRTSSLLAPPREGVEEETAAGPAGVTLGDYVTVEVAASIEAGDTVVGEGTVLGVGARIGTGAVIGKHCTLTPHTIVAAGDVIPDFTVIYSNGTRRTDRRGVADLRNKGQARQIEVLRRMIPSNPAKFQ
ncbi:trimeric LpxA-like protein [Apodospora peruviana]|uniref:Dynactin subunit 6 n=1 Tax=Apodospora peruviana TaxID=516989 RepID=A0AAE0I0I8_9PEZI|nr:trimeric LpxA-like protein [Apodospora peruviana]